MLMNLVPCTSQNRRSTMSFASAVSAQELEVQLQRSVPVLVTKEQRTHGKMEVMVVMLTVWIPTL
jgi:hypothetical protein